ncbi:MAG TPA: acyl-CoA dehydrogenase family protein [Acidimicrobiales bacterium]|jgi:alkylation response protein AidB-like acyl-CoA dehydrogenase
MDVRYSPEQVALRDAASQLVDRLAPRAVRELEDSDRAAKLDAALEATGWREVRAGDDSGRPLGSGVDAAIVAEQLGRGLADTPFLGPALAVDLRRRAGAPQSAGEETVLLSAELDALAMGPSSALAVDAGRARTALLLMGSPDEYALGEVAVEPVEGRTDLTRGAAAPLPEPVPIRVGARTLTADDMASWVALGLALTCADLVGTMTGAVDLACRYASSRHQYGVAIGSFQAVQHLLADAHVATEGSRSLALHAAWAVDALPAGEALVAAATAKAYCARAARSVCETAIQIHGGIGNTWECMAHVFLRRALLSTAILGGEGVNLARVLDHHGLGR